MKKLLAIVLIFSLILGGGYYAFSSFKKSLETGEVRTKTEERIAKIFGAKVTIGKIRLKFLKRLSFSDLQFDKGYVGPHLILTRVERIVFDYSWRNLLNRNFRSPKEVFFKSPKLLIESFDLPSILHHWDLLHLASGKSAFSVKIEDGTMTWGAKAIDIKTGLSNLNGYVEKKSPGEVYLRFSGNLMDSLNGKISWEGKLIPKTRQSDIHIRLHEIQHVSSNLPLFHDLSGSLHLKDSTLFVEKITFQVSSLSFEVRGRIDNFFDPNPKFQVQIKETSKFTGGELKFDLDGDFKSQKIGGTFAGLGGNFPFRGDLSKDRLGFQIRNVQIGKTLFADFDLVFSDWLAHVKLTQGKERYVFRVSLKNFNVDLDTQVDHLQLFDFDIVTRAHLTFKPELDAWNQGNLVFNAAISTDYLVFDYVPLQDLQGDFVLSGEGIRNLKLVWGNGYQTTGEIIFGKPPLVAFDISAEGVVLSETHRFGFHSLPDNLTGMMDGKIMIRGEARQPEISGHLGIDSGSVKQLTFDHLLLNFYGNRHYMKLKDSKVTRGSRSFYLRGDIDFSNKNIFSGVEIISEDHTPVWSGKEMAMQSVGSPASPVTEKPVAQIERHF